MNALCQRPQIDELVFQVYSRPVHPELFDIQAVRRVSREDCEITLQITRSGHVISWFDGNLCLTEIASSLDEALPRRGRLLKYRMRGERSGSFAVAKRITYQMNFQMERLAPEVFVQFHDELHADGAERGFLHNFQPRHRLSTAPLGFIAVEGRPGSWSIHSFHTFPEECAVVKVQSLIECD